MYRRGRSLRITPDVLADHILHTACLTPQGQQIGYIREVFEKYGGICPAQLLRNLAELDWRVNRTSGGSTVDLLSEVWGDITREFATADASGRVIILEVLTDFSYYQPRRMLDIAEFAMRNPTEDADDGSRPYRIVHRHVLAKLPTLLRHVGYSLECLPRACDLLWQLDLGDEQPLNTQLDHGLKVLAEFASYDPGKPVTYNDAVLQWVRRRVEAADSAPHITKLCDILDLFLEKCGRTTHSEGAVFSLRPFLVSEQNTRQIRDRAIDTLERLLLSADARTALRAVKSFRKVLHDPMPIGNPQVPGEICKAWEPEQLHVLDIFGRSLQRSRFAIVTFRILGSIRWAARFSRNDATRKRASLLADSLLPGFQLQLTELLLGEHQSLVDGQDYDGDVASSQAKQETRLKNDSVSLSNQIIQDYPNPVDAVHMISAALDLVRLDERPGSPATFLATIGEVNLAYSYEMCEATLATPERSLASCFAFLVAPIRRLHPEKGLDLLRRALASPHAVLWLAVGFYYYCPGWIESVADEDIEIIGKLVAHPNLAVRRMAIGAAWNLGKVRPQAAKQYVLSIDIGNDTTLADDLFLRLCSGVGVPWVSLRMMNSTG